MLQRLGEDKVNLYKRKDTFKRLVQQLTSQYEALKTALNENETHAQVWELFYPKIFLWNLNILRHILPLLTLIMLPVI